MSGNRDDYTDFLAKKIQVGADEGFDPVWMPEFLYDFQVALTEWALRKGRAAILADCGLGKTPMQLVWAENVRRYTNRPVLIVTPLAVSYQTVREAEKFNIEVIQSRDGKHSGGIVVTNYERLHYFNPAEFSGVVGDEGSAIKNFAGATRKIVTEFLRTIRYRLFCTATAAPNDYHELGTLSDALGYLGHQDMLTRFFKEDVIKDYLGWGRKMYRFRGHAEGPFWEWVCSWARACRKPSDLGYDDGDFVLPPLIETEHIIKCSKPREGTLLVLPARDLKGQRAERRETLTKRCEGVAEIVGQTDDPSVTWCHLNDEADVLEKIIPDSLQVAGSMSDEKKEERLLAFQAGELKHLITKPRIGCFGLNWQHCHRVMVFPSHSWEQYYQAVRRCWRFGQQHPVNVHIVTTEGEARVLQNLQRKAARANAMFDNLTGAMSRELSINRSTVMNEKEKVPQWL